MKEEIIRKVAKEVGLTNEDLFVKFFSKRFPNENDKILSYVTEWAGRFMSGNPVAYMDEQSKKIYMDLLKGD